MPHGPMLGGIEAGGTKFVCAIGPDPHTVLRETSFPTSAPGPTLDQAIAFFRAGAAAFGPIGAIGIGSFGPLALDPAAPDHGSIMRTPKPGWSGTPLTRIIGAALGCPVAIDTDVNASGRAEAASGAGQGRPSLAYVTIGTGIGGGLIRSGTPLHGLSHPEFGHIRPRRHPADDFNGLCPFHSDCLEGLASGKALFARTGRRLDTVPHDDPIWAIAADYLGQLCTTLVLVASPHVIVLGGGVMHGNPRLFAPIRRATQTLLAGYVASAALDTSLDAYIVPPALGPRAGVIGALMLAAALSPPAPRIPARSASPATPPSSPSSPPSAR